MKKTNEKVSVAVGNTHFVLKDGQIESVSRDGTTLTTDDDKFLDLVCCIFVIASTNHKKSLVSLLNQLSPKKGDLTYSAVLILKQCELTVPLNEAVNVALGK